MCHHPIEWTESIADSHKAALKNLECVALIAATDGDVLLATSGRCVLESLELLNDALAYMAQAADEAEDRCETCLEPRNGSCVDGVCEQPTSSVWCDCGAETNEDGLCVLGCRPTR